MFRVNNKDIRTTSNVSFVDFEQVNVYWDVIKVYSMTVGLF